MSCIMTSAVTGPKAWRPGDFAGNESWIYRLSPESIEELEAALRLVESKGLRMPEIRKTDFPLPTLQFDLARITDELRAGRGFVLIKGIPVDRYDDEQIRKIYWGLGTHIGIAVSQTSAGDLLCSVRDEGLDIRNTRVRGYQTTAVNEFHVDGSDVVGLLCLKTAKAGGESWIVSSMAIYNELLRRYPWYVGLLYDDFYFDWRGEEPAGCPPAYSVPIFSYFEGVLSCRYSRRRIDSAAPKMGVELSAVQREALDAMDALAHELSLRMNFEPGDVQLLNNHVILHARTEYEDYPEPEKKRHLLRLWLYAPAMSALSPQCEREGYGRSGVPITKQVVVPQAI